MSLTKRIVKDSIQYSLSSYIYSTFKIFSSVMIRKVLPLTAMGNTTSLFLIIDHVKLNHLGVLNALDREVPYHKGKNDQKKIEDIQSTSLNFYFLITLITSSILGVAILILKHFTGNSPFLDGLMYVPLFLIAYTFFSYHRVILRAQNQFSLLSKLNILTTMIEIPSTILFVILFGVKGIVISIILTYFICCLYLKLKGQFNISINLFSIKLKELTSLLKIGFPLLIDQIVMGLFLRSDQFIIVFFLGQAELGLYSLALLAVNFIMPFSQTLYNVIAPRFYEAYGKCQDIHAIKKYLITPTIVITSFTAIFIGTAIIILPPFVYHVLPKYVNGLFAIKTLLFSTFFLSVINMWGYFLIATYRQNQIVVLNSCAMIINIILNVILIYFFNLGINGVALATTLAYMISSTFYIFYVHSFFTKKVKKHILLIFRIYFPILWVALVLFFMQPYIIYPHNSLFNDIYYTSFLIAIFLTTCLPLFFLINKESRIFNLLVQVFKEYKFTAVEKAY